MIWESIPLMTLFDVVIVVVTVWSLRILFTHRKQLLETGFRVGSSLITGGLIVIGLFYLADLSAMWLLPLMTSPMAAMAAMEALHLNYSWILMLGGMVSIVVGFAYMMRSFFQQAANLERQAEARHESEARYRSFIAQTSDAVFCYEYDPPIPTHLPVEEQAAMMFESYLVECNDVCAKTYDAQHREEVIGKRFRDLTPSTDEGLMPLFRVFVQGSYRTTDAEAHEVLPDGSIRFYLNNSHGIVEDGLLVRTWGTFRDVTDRVHAREALKKSEEQLRLALDAAQMGTWSWEITSGEVTWSDNVEAIFGLAPGTFDGTYDAYRTLIYPDDLIALDQAINQALTEGKNYIVEHRITGPDGDFRWLEGRGQIYHDETGTPVRMAGTVTDITKRKRADEALRELNAELEERVQARTFELEATNQDLHHAKEEVESQAEHLATLNQITQAVVQARNLRQAVDTVVKQAPNLIDGSVAAYQLVDVAHNKLTSASDAIVDGIKGQTFLLDSIPPLHRVAQTQKSLVFSEADTASLPPPVSEQILAQNIQEILVVPSLARGEVMGMLVFMHTQKGRRFTQAEIRLAETVAGNTAGIIEQFRLIEREHDAREAAEVANRAKTEFLANMSHELRTPLNAILGFAQLMARDQALAPAYQENLGIIIRSGEHLLELINDVLEMSKIEAGRTALAPSSFDLYQMLDTLEDMFRVRALSKGLSLQFLRAGDIPRYIYTDARKLRQVLINLLSNAIKFTDKGGVLFRLQAARMPESATNGNGQIRMVFDIEDSGAGIDLEERTTLFDTFSQTERGRQTHEGTGLGLAISQRFVEMLGGTITVESQPEQGSTFTFDVVVEVTEAASIAPSLPQQRVIGLAPGQVAPRILIAEDNETNRALLAQLLQSVGFDVREAVDGREALAAWEAWQPHLVWMDMRMPVMNGYDATRAIKATTHGQTPIVIALTANAFEEDRTKVFSAGCDDFVRKPFQEAEIFDTMARHLGVRYQYEENGPTVAAQERGNEDMLIGALDGLPPDWVRSLREAATHADADLLHVLLNDLGAEHQPLAQTLENIVHNFRFDKIIVATTSVQQDHVV